LKHVEFLFLPAGVQNLASDAFNGLEYVGLLKLAYLDLIELSPFTFRGLNFVRQLAIENSDLVNIDVTGARVSTIRISKKRLDLKMVMLLRQQFVLELLWALEA